MRPLLVLLCAATAVARPAHAAAHDDPDTVLLLIGDAGAPARRGEPVLHALRSQAARDPSRTIVVFLGDNVYPNGLPPDGHRKRSEAERRLRAQLDAVRVPGLRALFVPGNHDWDGGGPDGLDAVRRQARFVREHGAPGSELLPEHGCPGPEVRDLGSRLRLVLLDTQWFLHDFEKGRGPESPCLADTDAEVVAALASAVAGAGERQVVVAGHHPLASGGPHGGRFSARQHVFPLTDWKPWLWVPLPGLGSLYAAARKAGVTPQDLAAEANERWRALMAEALAGRPALAWAAGHEHSLQVIESGGAARFVLVSGSGSRGHTTPVAALEGTRYAAAEAGFLRLVLPAAGPARLSVLVVDAAGRASERYTTALE